MGEGASLDHALRRIVVDEHAFELGQELVAVPLAGAEPPRRAGVRERLLHPVGAERVRARPFRRGAAVASLDPGFESAGTGQGRQHSGATARIVAGVDQIADAEPVRLIFLLARETERCELRAGLEHLRDGIAQASADDASEDRAEDSSDRAAPRIGFTGLGMIGRDMADFVPQREGQLRLIVHEAHQLARDVDIAARDRERILDRRVEHGEAIGSGSHSRISGDPPPDAVDIGRARTGLRSPELGDHLRMVALRLLDIARIEPPAADLGRRKAGRDRKHRRPKKQER